MKPPILHMSNSIGRFHLFSDSSKFATGSALYQIQTGKPKVARNYSITELDLCSLAINAAGFSLLLKRVDIDTIVDHLSLTLVIKSKAESANTRIN